MTVLLLILDKKYFAYSKQIVNSHNIGDSDSIIVKDKPKEVDQITDQNTEISKETININEIQNNINKLKTELEKKETLNLRKSLGGLKKLEKVKLGKLKNDNKNHKKKKVHHTKDKRVEDEDEYFMFYNTLSLIMLSMIAGGLVGVIFIL